MSRDLGLLFFFFNDTATTEIYTLSLHDALPISLATLRGALNAANRAARDFPTSVARLDAMKRQLGSIQGDRKSTRLNSSHLVISYAVFCLKKKKINQSTTYSNQPIRALK